MNNLIVENINSLLKNHKWCDFEIIEMKDNLIIGGRTSFNTNPDFTVEFNDVFYIQCLASWKTDTASDAFFIPDLNERRKINIDYGVEEGYTLFKITPEDLGGVIYISAKKILLRI